MGEKECNAIIMNASISKADHGMLTAMITLDYGGSAQGFGNYRLFQPKFDGDQAGLFLWRVMEVAGVERWEKICGKTVRVRIDGGLIHAVGHIVKDDWFCPREELE